MKDKVIVVTGSCTGIGKAIVRRCVKEGASVIVHGLQTSLGESLVNELGSDRTALLIEDLTNDGAPGRLVEFAVRKFGKLDAIVNNAAMIATGTIQDTSAERFNEFIRINTLAPYLLIRAALPELSLRGGAVLNIG
ncbi:SDR family oxidoreductase, partial [Mariniblastus sp.]|nr:SDR family oxidoreductase [Mariniblastus sp.]